MKRFKAQSDLTARTGTGQSTKQIALIQNKLLSSSKWTKNGNRNVYLMVKLKSTET